MPLQVRGRKVEAFEAMNRKVPRAKEKLLIQILMSANLERPEAIVQIISI